MKFAIFQTDVKDWAESTACDILAGYCHEAKNNNCVMAFAPGGFISSAGLSKFHCSDYNWLLSRLAEKIADTVPLFIGSPDASGSNFLLRDGVKYVLPDIFEFQNRKLIFSESANLLYASMPVWRILLKPVVWQKTIQPAFFSERANNARSERCWIIQPNLSGAVSTAIYGGQSMVIDPEGNLALIGGLFESGVLFFDTDDYEIQPVPQISPFKAQWAALVEGTADFVRANDHGKAIVGLSGGMDSSLVACIACEALGSANLVGVLMPSVYTKRQSIDDAEELAANLGIKTITIPITPMQECFAKALTPTLEGLPQLPGNLTWENLQARIRGILLMAISNATGALVLNTGNRSEGETGYCTLHGDMVGALSVIGDLYKTRVYELARWYCDQKGKMIIPGNVFTREPSAELAPNQKDSDILPPYPELDSCLQWLSDQTLPKPESERIEEVRQRVCKSVFKKRYLPPALEVALKSY